MNRTRTYGRWLGLLLFMASNVPSSFATPQATTSGGQPDYQGEFLAVVSGLQSLALGTYSRDEWNSLTARLDHVLQQAIQRRDDNWVIEAVVLKAKIASEMQHQHQEALRLLGEVKGRYAGRTDLPAMRKVFVEEAAVRGRLGDEAGVNRVIQEFRNSPHFDPADYDFHGGLRPGDPLVVTRPGATGSESISVSTTQVQRRRAHYAAGQPFPDFRFVDHQGQVRKLDDYRGKVLLIDFWASQMAPWRQSLSYHMDMYQRYRGLGLEVLGINIEPDAAAAEAFSLANNIPWSRVYGDRNLARELGLFGQTATYLLDGNGIILARDLRGSDLNAAVRQALGLRP